MKSITHWIDGRPWDGPVERKGAVWLEPKLVAQIVWYGSVRTPFTFGCIAELLERAGFARIRACALGESGEPELARFDNRARESLFVEALRP